MTNIVFSPALQAPIALANPTGGISLSSDPSLIITQANPIPPQAILSLVGSAVKLALAMKLSPASVGAVGNTAQVVSGLVTRANPVSGSIGLSSASPIVSQSIATNALSFPRVMLVGVGGDQSYGCNATTGYPNWRTAAGGSAANVAVQTIGSYDVAILSGVFEGWDTSGVRDRENLTQALLKNATYPVTKNTARATKVFYYEIMNATISGNPYAQWQSLVDANNWYLYESIGGVGTKTPAGGGQSFLNYSTAWPGAIGSAGIGASICGANYGTTSSGSPTGIQGPARTFGNYAALKLLIRASTVDTRFSFNAQMASPSAAGVFLDECFVALDGAGTVPDSSLDGITIAHGSQQGGGFPGLDTVQPVMARGIHNMFDQLQTMLGAYGTAGKTYYNFANFGQYANKYQFGTTTLTCGLENTLHGGLLENVLAADGSSWECFQTGNTNTGNTNYASGWPNLLANYYQGMDFCLSPKLVGVGTKLPATDGSQTASIPSGAGTALTTVTTGTAAEYQLMRYGLCTTLLDDGYFCPGVHGYDWSVLRWYDEYGDDSLTQVNVPRGYLGAALSARPSSPTWAQGTLGVWARAFTNGIAIVNPRGNGAQTVTLGATYTRLGGTQQPTVNSGASVTSVTIGDGDGLILLGPVTSPGTQFLQENYNTYPVGNVTSVTAALSAKGYSNVTYTNAGDIRVLARASLPAGLLSNTNFPAGKTQVMLFTLPILEDESRLTWTGFPNSTTRDVSWSWWEYRDNNNNGGEKFHRAGNYVSGTIGANRGIDDIMGMGLPAGTLTLFSNSGNMHSFPDQAFGVFNWPSGLHHFERVDHLPTDTSATYSCSFYIDGVLQGSVSGLQIYDTAAQAAVGWQLWDFGGWASGSGTFPINRYICAARIASQRQGVWAMPAV